MSTLFGIALGGIGAIFFSVSYPEITQGVHDVLLQLGEFASEIVRVYVI